MFDPTQPIFERDGLFDICVNGRRYGSGPEDKYYQEVEAYLAEHPEALTPEPMPPPPSAEEIERQRIAGIMASLAALDLKAVRPMRAIAAGTGGDEDHASLAAIEAEAAALRGEL